MTIAPDSNNPQDDLIESKALLERIYHDIEKYDENSPAGQKKHWRNVDRAAHQFLHDHRYIHSLMRELGDAFWRLIATTNVPLGIASIISGIPEGDLRSLPSLKNLNSDEFSLGNIADIAGDQTEKAVLLPYRPSYQATVNAYLSDGKIPHGESSLFLNYLDMEEKDAKHYEGYIRALAIYFEMHPPPSPADPPIQDTTAAKAIDSTDEPAISTSAGQKDIIVPLELCKKGRHPPAIRDGMRKAGYDDFVIAHVIYEWCEQRNDLFIGNLLFVPRNPDHPERGKSEDALRERSKKLRQKAMKYKIIIR